MRETEMNNLVKSKYGWAVPVGDVISRIESILGWEPTQLSDKPVRVTSDDRLRFMRHDMEYWKAHLRLTELPLGEIEEDVPFPKDYQPKLKQRVSWSTLAKKMSVGDSVQLFTWSEGSSLKSAMHSIYGHGSSVSRKIGGTPGSEIVRVWRKR